MRAPDYYKEFTCIGGACKDSCCIGWDVYVDEKSAKKYQKVEGSFGEKLKENLVIGDETYIQMKEDGRCPFLNDENLCDIYIELGEESLCEICTKHPRFMDTYDGVTEIGLGISCEVAADLILNWKERVKIIGNCSSKNPYFLYRDMMIQMLQNRNQPIFERWGNVLSLGQQMQEKINKGEELTHIKDVPKIDAKIDDIDVKKWILEVTDVFKDFEYMTEEFPGILERTYEITSKRIDETIWEQLSIYFVYRHFMKCLFDENPLEKVEIALLGFLCIYIWSQDTKEDVVETARLYSKEMEYSEENMDALREEILFGGCFSREILKKVLVACENL